MPPVVDCSRHLHSARFTGILYIVNARLRTEIAERQVHSRVTELPEPSDLVVIAVSTGDMMKAIGDCICYRVKALAVVSSIVLPRLVP